MNEIKENIHNKALISKKLPEKEVTVNTELFQDEQRYQSKTLIKTANVW